MVTVTMSIWVGPVTVRHVAQMLREKAMPWQRVSIEGTERVWVEIEATAVNCAETEMRQWQQRAGLKWEHPVVEKTEVRDDIPIE